MIGQPGAASLQPLEQLDACLAELGRTLQGSDAAAVERAAEALQASLDRAFTVLRQPGATTPSLRRHLALAAGRVAAQREALARASASVDRAIEVLLPVAGASTALYGSSGATERSHGSAQATA